MCRDATDAPDPEDDSDTTPRLSAAFERVLGRGKRRMVFTMGVALAFGMFGKLSGIPAVTMVCALFGVIALNLTLGCCHMPMGTKRFAQLLAGSLVGSTISAETFSSA